MKKSGIIFGVVLALISVILFYFSPDMISMFFIAAMFVILALGFTFGIYRVSMLKTAFMRANAKMEEINSVSMDDNWLLVRESDPFFRYSLLDKVFLKYRADVEKNRRNKDLYLRDIEEYINEDFVEIRSYKSLVQAIPAVLTGLGLLGTFYGLVTGLGDIRFSSADVVVSSITNLVSGIDTAFYTSIAGVSLSIVFEIFIKLEWNFMLKSMYEFLREFHNGVVPSIKDQERDNALSYQKEILDRLDKEKHEETQE